jgi:4a-hydroxytetrahydrobiopterin dehydratase
MADPLDRAAIDTALRSLAGWSYDGEALVRQVDVAADDQDALEESVAAVADALNHHPDVTRQGGSVTFRLRTHSANAVTTKDVDLAARIDQVLSGSGSR